MYISIRDGLLPAYKIGGSTDPAEWGTVPTSSHATWNAVEIVEGANGWRLPTEHEWEFAAKGGRLSVGHGGRVGDRPANTGATETHTYFVHSGSNTVTEVSWHDANSGSRTRPVGSLQANELGLHDMSGNVWERTWDRLPPPTGVTRVIRGGSWFNSAANTRSATRDKSNLTARGQHCWFPAGAPLVLAPNGIVLDSPAFPPCNSVPSVVTIKNHRVTRSFTTEDTELHSIAPHSQIFQHIFKKTLRMGVHGAGAS